MSYEEAVARQREAQEGTQQAPSSARSHSDEGQE